MATLARWTSTRRWQTSRCYRLVKLKLMGIPHLTWILVTVLRFGGLLALFVGFAVFGAYFVAGNVRAARSGDGTIPASSWQGAGPRVGTAIFALGASMLLCALIFALYLPSGI